METTNVQSTWKLGKYSVWRGNTFHYVWSKTYEKGIFCGQSLVLAYLFAFFWTDVEFCQVIINISACSGGTSENNEARWFIGRTCPVVQLICPVYTVFHTVYCMEVNDS